MSKIIIVEGVDNCGKDHVISLIHSILEEKTKNNKKNIKNYYNIVESHCIKPTIDTNKYNTSLKMEIAMGHYYSNMMCQHLEYCFKQCDGKNATDNYIIMNRSFLGEYVYSQLYRNVEEEHANLCQDMVYRAIINKIYYMYGDTYDISDFIYNNIVFIYCNCPVTWSLKHEDGDSMSNSSEECIKNEKKLFDSLYNKCNWLNKFKYETVTFTEDGTCKWKHDDTGIVELKLKLGI